MQEKSPTFADKNRKCLECYGKPVQMCCNGTDCGCLGLPIEPPCQTCGNTGLVDQYVKLEQVGDWLVIVESLMKDIKTKDA